MDRDDDALRIMIIAPKEGGGFLVLLTFVNETSTDARLVSGCSTVKYKLLAI